MLLSNPLGDSSIWTWTWYMLYICTSIPALLLPCNSLLGGFVGFGVFFLFSWYMCLHTHSLPYHEWILLFHKQYISYSKQPAAVRKNGDGIDGTWILNGAQNRTKHILDFRITWPFAIEALMHRPASYSGRPFSQYCRKLLASRMTLHRRNKGKRWILLGNKQVPTALLIFCASQLWNLLSGRIAKALSSSWMQTHIWFSCLPTFSKDCFRHCQVPCLATVSREEWWLSVRSDLLASYLGYTCIPCKMLCTHQYRCRRILLVLSSTLVSIKIGLGCHIDMVRLCLPTFRGIRDIPIRWHNQFVIRLVLCLWRNQFLWMATWNWSKAVSHPDEYPNKHLSEAKCF